MAKDATLIIYTHPDCSYSAAAKADMDGNGIPYKEIDVTLHPEAIQELERLTGGERTTPVIVEDGHITIGYMGVG